MVKKRLKFQAAAILATLALTMGPALVAAETPPGPTPAGGTLEQRVAQRKAERGTALIEKDFKRLLTTCVAAQIKLRVIQKDDVAMFAKRTRVYGAIDSKLWIVTGQLKLANQDTFQLQKQHQDLVGKIGNFQTIATDYRQALDDTVVMNCQADPNGFKALLDTTRIYYTQLHAQSTATQAQILNTIKPTLKTHINDLQAKPVNAPESQ